MPLPDFGRELDPDELPPPMRVDLTGAPLAEDLVPLTGRSVSGYSLARRQSDLEIKTREVDIAIKRAELALNAYRYYGRDGVGVEGEIITRDEVRAVVLLALGAPIEGDA